MKQADRDTYLEQIHFSVLPKTVEEEGKKKKKKKTHQAERKTPYIPPQNSLLALSSRTVAEEEKAEEKKNKKHPHSRKKEGIHTTNKFTSRSFFRCSPFSCCSRGCQVGKLSGCVDGK